MIELKRLHEAATVAPWNPFDGRVYFPKGAGGFSLIYCPLPAENVALIAYMRNHAQDFIELIEAAKRERDTRGLKPDHPISVALQPFEGGK